jgi:hypothetical protein
MIRMLVVGYVFAIRSERALGWRGFCLGYRQNIPLTKIDPPTNKVVVQFVGAGGDALRVGLGRIWLCSFFLEEAWHVSLDF